MGKRLYQIILWGSEDSRECRMMLTAEEADILCRLEDELHPLKGYVPHIVVVDIEKSEEEARKLEEKKAAEAKAKLDHAMGLDRTFETSMAAAFRKAKSKKATEQNWISEIKLSDDNSDWQNCIPLPDDGSEDEKKNNEYKEDVEEFRHRRIM